MRLQALAVFFLAVAARATDVAADFEKACQAGQQDCIESTEDMYLIQKKLEVGSTEVEDPEESTTAEPDPFKAQKDELKKEAEAADGIADEAAADANDLIDAEDALGEALKSAKEAATTAQKDAEDAKKAAKIASKISAQSAVAVANLEAGVGSAPGTAGGDENGDEEGAFGGESSVPAVPTCPCGFTAKIGQTPLKLAFGQKPDVKTLKECAKECRKQDACQSFEFALAGTPSCVLNTDREPTSELESEEYMFCAKGYDCEVTPPWKDWDASLTMENNLRNVWTIAHRCWLQTVACWILTWGIWVTLSLLVLKMINGTPDGVYGETHTEDPVESFQYGQFDCMKRFEICIFAFACPGARWAATMDLAGFLPATTALLAYAAMGFLNGLISINNTKFGGEGQLCAEAPLTGPLLAESAGVGPGAGGRPAMPSVHEWTVYEYAVVFFEGLSYFTMVGICTAVLIVFYRQKLRSKLNLPSGSCSALFFDFMYVFFCPWCAVAQEAQVVQYAYVNGAKVRKVVR
jgi:Cys-rich protein (TIGR01571 family)